MAEIGDEEVKLRAGEDLFTYLGRLFPLFLEAVEVMWGPMNVASAKKALRRAAIVRVHERRGEDCS